MKTSINFNPVEKTNIIGNYYQFRKCTLTAKIDELSISSYITMLLLKLVLLWFIRMLFCTTRTVLHFGIFIVFGKYQIRVCRSQSFEGT